MGTDDGVLDDGGRGGGPGFAIFGNSDTNDNFETRLGVDFFLGGVIDILFDFAIFVGGARTLEGITDLFELGFFTVA